jgi:asparagine synthase (glutamine-hydrolysing)
MCGIAAIIDADHWRVGPTLARMTNAQSHRGPDDAGEIVAPFAHGYIGLGHRRLSILDLSAAGHQPMQHPGTGDWIVFNGEIYNFAVIRRELACAGISSRGHSDTEVLLHALARWGPECLRRMEGMYAFAYFDAVNQRLILARDPAGIKPLYFARSGDTLLFASEVRALLASGLIQPRLDPQGVAGYLAYGAVQHPCTLFRNIRSLLPGSWMEIRPSSQGLWEVGEPQLFWRYPQPELQLGDSDTIALVRTTLDDAVRDHLVSDVPVGVFLSSGLDSTIVASLAARHSKELRSFTVVFADQPDFSEQRLAAKTARQCGLQHVEIALPAEEAEAAALEWLTALDQPSMDGLNVYVISRAVRRQGIKVALSGQGGDELFGGYPSFRDVPRLRRLVSPLRRLPVGARRQLGTIAGVGRSTAVRGKLADVFASDGSVRSIALLRRRVLSDRQLARLGIRAADLGLTPDVQPPGSFDGMDLDDEADVIAAVSRLESRFYQGNVLLRDADANGMAHGLEIRVPFLDQRLLDFVHALPGSQRLPRGAPGKYLLRRACADLLRPELLDQPKRGFTLPLRRWMIGSLRPLCEQGLTALKDTGMLRPKGIDAVWQSFLREPESPLWTRALTLSVLGSYIVKTGAVV